MLIINSGYKNIIFLFKLKAVEQDARCLFTAWRMPNLPLSFRMHKNLSFDTAASKNKWRSSTCTVGLGEKLVTPSTPSV